MPRILIIVPSWLGDSVMATPALRRIRRALPGAFIGALVRPGIDQVLGSGDGPPPRARPAGEPGQAAGDADPTADTATYSVAAGDGPAHASPAASADPDPNADAGGSGMPGADLIDEFHVHHATGVLGPKFVAAKVRPRRYDAALILTNSFSTALIARIAGIPRRVGYSRDARALLLTDRLLAPRRHDGAWSPVPAVAYYLHAAECLLDPARDPSFPAGAGAPAPPWPEGTQLEIPVGRAQRSAGRALLRLAGVPDDRNILILNPGGNNPAKRWPIERFADTAAAIHARHGLWALVNGSPAEADLALALAEAVRQRGAPAAPLPALGVTIGGLKGLLSLPALAAPPASPSAPGASAAGPTRCQLMITNDTGPRHLAAALGVPVVTLFGPTDRRWTTIPSRQPPAQLSASNAPTLSPPPARPMQAHVLADPDLPEDQTADDHPARCRIERIQVASVLQAAFGLLEPPSPADQGFVPPRP